jgi:hypothetical protein
MGLTRKTFDWLNTLATTAIAPIDMSGDAKNAVSSWAA